MINNKFLMKLIKSMQAANNINELVNIRTHYYEVAQNKLMQLEENVPPGPENDEQTFIYTIQIAQLDALYAYRLTELLDESKIAKQVTLEVDENFKGSMDDLVKSVVDDILNDVPQEQIQENFNKKCLSKGKVKN